MATRPIFLPTDTGRELVETRMVEFHWFPGMALSQARRSIESLHEAAHKRLPNVRILEISSKSPHPVGVSLSAFNLMIRTVKYGRELSVESAYQGSKVFERGGPYKDLFELPGRNAKKDPRLRDSGRLLKFWFCGAEWGLEPKTAFYNWLYINALYNEIDLAAEMGLFDAYSDIAFNPDRSINCQAYAAALYVSLANRSLLEDAVKDREFYMDLISEPTRDSPSSGQSTRSLWSRNLSP